MHISRSESTVHVSELRSADFSESAEFRIRQHFISSSLPCAPTHLIYKNSFTAFAHSPAKDLLCEHRSM